MPDRFGTPSLTEYHAEQVIDTVHVITVQRIDKVRTQLDEGLITRQEYLDTVFQMILDSNG